MAVAIAFVLKNWKLVAGGLAVAILGLMLIFARADASHWHKLADSRAATIAQFAEAQKLADAAARKALADTEARYKEQANEADTKHADALADAGTAADRYIASHRVPVCTSGRSTGSAVGPTSGGDTSVPESLPADSVFLSAADVQACSGAVTYSLAAHDWAVGLERP